VIDPSGKPGVLLPAGGSRVIGSTEDQAGPVPLSDG
jgi:hypothetical protein